jgi:hypothetical protein
LSPFLVEKTIQGHIGTTKSTRKLRSGILLVEVARETQATNLLKLTKISDLEVKVSPHRTMNFSRGVIRSADLAQMDESELLTSLKPQNVSEIRYIWITRDGTKRKTNTMIMTFAQPIIPKSIRAGYLSVKVEQYVPSPLRCFQCQQFGHHRTVCRRAAACAKCGQADHGDAPCDKLPHCVNCNGDHTAFDKNCPKWLSEKEIVKIKTNNQISFPEARAIVAAKTPQVVVGTSYAAATKAKQMKSVAVQTDIVNCKCQPTETPAISTFGQKDCGIQTGSPKTLEPFMRVMSEKTKQQISNTKSNLKSPNRPTTDNPNSASSTTSSKSTASGATPARPKSVSPRGRRTQRVGRPGSPFEKGYKETADKGWRETGSEPVRIAKGVKDPLHGYDGVVEDMEVAQPPSPTNPKRKGRTKISGPT